MKLLFLFFGIFMLVCSGVLLAPLGTTDGLLVAFGICGGTFLIENALC